MDKIEVSDWNKGFINGMLMMMIVFLVVNFVGFFVDYTSSMAWLPNNIIICSAVLIIVFLVKSKRVG